VVGETELGQASFDSVFDVALHGAAGMSTPRGVRVVIDQGQGHCVKVSVPRSAFRVTRWL
jgi:hypothetical protein